MDCGGGMDVNGQKRQEKTRKLFPVAGLKDFDGNLWINLEREQNSDYFTFNYNEINMIIGFDIFKYTPWYTLYAMATTI